MEVVDGSLMELYRQGYIEGVCRWISIKGALLCTHGVI
jgi:hypothetical protein